jgi:hypothetical protein
MAAFAVVLTQEQAVEIKVLARRGTAVREIARQTAFAQITVRRYLRDEQARRYKPREPRATKLYPFKDYPLERVAAARPHWIPATVLLRELQVAGYTGGISRLEAFLPPINIAKPSRSCASRRHRASRSRPISPSAAEDAGRCSRWSRRWAMAARALCDSPRARTQRRCANARREAPTD